MPDDRNLSSLPIAGYGEGKFLFKSDWLERILCEVHDCGLAYDFQAELDFLKVIGCEIVMEQLDVIGKHSSLARVYVSDVAIKNYDDGDYLDPLLYCYPCAILEPSEVDIPDDWSLADSNIYTNGYEFFCFCEGTANQERFPTLEQAADDLVCRYFDRPDREYTVSLLSPRVIQLPTRIECIDHIAKNAFYQELGMLLSMPSRASMPSGLCALSKQNEYRKTWGKALPAWFSSLSPNIQIEVLDLAKRYQCYLPGELLINTKRET